MRLTKLASSCGSFFFQKKCALHILYKKWERYFLKKEWNHMKLDVSNMVALLKDTLTFVWNSCTGICCHNCRCVYIVKLNDKVNKISEFVWLHLFFEKLGASVLTKNWSAYFLKEDETVWTRKILILGVYISSLSSAYNTVPGARIFITDRSHTHSWCSDPSASMSIFSLSSN